MRIYPAALKAVGGARTGIAPANLLDIQDVNGNLYFLSDRAIVAPTAILGAASVSPPLPAPLAAGQAMEWALPTKVTKQTSTAGLAIGSLSGGYMSMDGSGIAADSSLAWGGFSCPPLPSDAVVDQIYHAAVVSQTNPTPPTAPSAILFSNMGPLVPSDAFFNLYISTSTNEQQMSVEAATGLIATAILYADYQQSETGLAFQAVTISFVGIAVYYTSASISANSPIAAIAPNIVAKYKPWLVGVPQIGFNRSLQTDIGSFAVQNISGTTLQRDAEEMIRASALEGALFVYRCWQPDAQAAWVEVHGTLTVEDVSRDTLMLKGVQAINPAQDDTPLEEYSETCQWNWGLARCGSTQATECLYSYPTCQVLERIGVVMNNFEKNYGETVANTPLVTINRARKV